QDGGLAEYQVAPERCLYPVPTGLPFDEAIMVKTVGVPLHAMEMVRLKPGESVAVIGPGSIGLLAAMLSALAGATRVIVIGLTRDEERLAFARARGFETLADGPDDVLSGVLELTGGRGVDVVFEASGGRGTFKSAVELVRLGGQIALIGLPSEEPFNPSRLINKSIAVYGSSMRSASTWERALNLVSTRALDVRPLLTHHLPLSKTLDAFELLKQGVGIKIIVAPD
ncbi:MAG: zinc-binding dehydrogenase, partial [Chloroflexota bacterium]|nr:zinc-binding dehydrogenase [Chloroflexota bacterium]